jgi:hypothetical protein
MFAGKHLLISYYSIAKHIFTQETDAVVPQVPPFLHVALASELQLHNHTTLLPLRLPSTAHVTVINVFITFASHLYVLHSVTE